GNYTFNASAVTTADITPRALTISASGVNKVYDGTVAASVNLADNRIAGDLLSTSYTSANFSDKNVGTAKTVSVSGISLSGVDAGNYTFNASAVTTADITPRALTISASGVNKYYDGTTTATVLLSDNRIAGDVLTASYTSANFSDANVGTNKTVTVSGISLSGTDSGNYTFNTTAVTTADILPVGVMISGAVYSDLGVTLLSGAIVTLVINGNVIASTPSPTDINGAYSFSSVTLSNGDRILVYIDNNTVKANTVTVATSSTSDIANLNLYGGYLTIGNGNATLPIAIFDHAQAKGGLTDPDIIYHIASLTTDPGFGIFVKANFTAGSIVNTENLIIDATGTVNGSTDTYNISGDWTNQGIWNAGSSTVNFTKASGTQTVTSGGSAFTNVNHSGLGTMQLIDAMTVTATLLNVGILDLNNQNWTMTGATLSNTGNILVRGAGNISLAANDTDSGTWTYTQSLLVKDFGAVDYYNLVLDGVGQTFTTSSALVMNGSMISTAGSVYAPAANTTSIGAMTLGGPVLPSASIEFASSTFALNASMNAGTFNPTVSANNMTIAGTIIGNVVTLRPVSSGQFIQLGGADTTSTLGLMDAELDMITANTLSIGSAVSGNMSVISAISPAGTNNLILTTGFSFNITASGSIMEPSMQIFTGQANAGSTNLFIGSLFGTVSLLGGSGNDVFTFTQMPTGTLNGNGGINILRGPNIMTNWTITSLNAGRISNSGGLVTFMNIQSLRGGIDKDIYKFNPGGTISGNIADSGGKNRLKFDVVVTLTGSDVIGYSGLATPIAETFSGISEIEGFGPADVVIGENVDSIWSLGVDQIYSDGSGFDPLLIIGFEVLQGGSANDRFVFADGASLTGVIDGGGGVNTMDYSAYTTPVTLNLASSTATAVNGFSNIGSFIGGSTSDFITAPNTNNIWHLTGIDSGDVNGISYSMIENLTGGTASDTFIFSDQMGITGILNGAGGTDVLDYSAYTTPVTVDLGMGTATGIGGGVSGVEQVTGVPGTFAIPDGGVIFSVSGDYYFTQMLNYPGQTLRILAGGHIFDANSGLDAVALNLVLSAGTGIGTCDNPIDSQVTNIAAITLAGGINIRNTGLLNIANSSEAPNGMYAASGNISIMNIGALAVNKPVTTDAGGIRLNSRGALAVNADITASGEITMKAGETDDPGIYADNLIVAANVKIESMSKEIDLRAGDDLITGPGSIVKAYGSVGIRAGVSNMDDYSSISLDGEVTSTHSSVKITAKSPITIGASAVITATGEVQLSAGEVIDAPIYRNSLYVYGTVRSLAHNVLLRAGDHINLEAGSSVVTNIGAVLIEAGRSDKDGAGALSQNGSVISAGDVVMKSLNNMTLSGLVTAAGTVTLNSRTGAVIDGNGSALNIQANSLSVRATNGIALNTSVSFVSARNGSSSNTGSGNISISNYLTSQGMLKVKEVDGISGIRNYAAKSAGNGNVDISNSSKLMLSAQVSANGDITATASEWVTAASGDDLIVSTGTKVQSYFGSITLRAGDNIIIEKGAQVIASGDITLDSGYGDNDSYVESDIIKGKVTAGGTVTLQ
ncbi:MAG: hypothetical protein HZC17_02035, partial [Candidatus Omnitrophica bacterium]|nr:hypothetical protein [Candidatus Omnitrophota bacterium]